MLTVTITWPYYTVLLGLLQVWSNLRSGCPSSFFLWGGGERKEGTADTFTYNSSTRSSDIWTFFWLNVMSLLTKGSSNPVLFGWMITSQTSSTVKNMTLFIAAVEEDNMKMRTKRFFPFPVRRFSLSLGKKSAWSQVDVSIVPVRHLCNFPCGLKRASQNISLLYFLLCIKTIGSSYCKAPTGYCFETMLNLEKHLYIQKPSSLRADDN